MSKYCRNYCETDPVLTLQSPGFAIIIDRRSEAWQWRDIQAAFSKIVAVFPGKIKEVFLLYKYPAGPSSHRFQLTAEYSSCRETHARTVGGE